MAAESKVTTNHEEIRKWVEARGGKPARVKGTGDENDPGLLRIDFEEPGGARDERLEPISWDEWFRKFDENKLAFLYQEETAQGQPSRFFKLVKRETVGAEARS
jgi:hypothetical protein